MHHATSRHVTGRIWYLSLVAVSHLPRASHIKERPGNITTTSAATTTTTATHPRVG